MGTAEAVTIASRFEAKLLLDKCLGVSFLPITPGFVLGIEVFPSVGGAGETIGREDGCLLYTSDAADE